jgi:hypothetical protein
MNSEAANLIVAGRERGTPYIILEISCCWIPIKIVSIIISTVYIYARFLM